MKKVSFLTLLISIFVFTACSNFLGTGKLKKEIEDKVKYESLKSFKVYSSVNSAIGRFLSETEKNVKLTDSIVVKFELLSEEYIFDNEWCAVSINDENISRDDAIEVYKIEKSKNIYTAEIKILKEYDDILITPVCKFISKLEDYSPKNSFSGVDYSKPIILKFNTPLKSSSLINFTDIKIINTTNNDNLTDFYALPAISDDGYSVHINPKENLYDYVNAHSDFEVQVYIDLKKIELADCNALSIDDEFTWNYSINSKFDTTKPVITSIQVAKSSDNLINGNLYEIGKTFDYDVLNKTVDDIHEAMCNSLCIKISAKDDDEGSGIRSIIVKEKCLAMLRSDDSTFVTDGLRFEGFNSDNEIENEILLESDQINKNSIDDYLLNYRLQHPMDGIIKVTFNVKDNFGNISTEKFVEIEKSVNMMMDGKSSTLFFRGESTNIKRCSDDSGYDSFKFYPDLRFGSHSNKRYKKLSFLKDSYSSSEYENPDIQVSKVFSGESKDDLIELKREEILPNPCTYEGRPYCEWLSIYSINRDTSKDTYFEVWAEDFIGNVQKWSTVLQKNVDVSYADNISINNGKLSANILCSEKPLDKFIVVYDILKENGELIRSTVSPVKYGTQEIFLNDLDLYGNDYCYVTFYVMPVMESHRDGREKCTYKDSTVQGCVGSGFTVPIGIPSNIVPVDTADLPDFDIIVNAPEKNSGKRTVSIVYDENFVKSKDLIYCTKYWEAGTSVYNTTVDTNIELESLKDWNISIEVRNKTGGILETSFKTVTLDYDNFPPQIETVNVIGAYLDAKALSVSIPHDDGVGMKYDEDGNGVLKVFFVNTYVSLTEEEIESYPYIDIKYNRNDEKIIINRFGHNEAYLYIKAEDLNSNCCYKQYLLHNFGTYINESYKLKLNHFEKSNSSNDTILYMDGAPVVASDLFNRFEVELTEMSNEVWSRSRYSYNDGKNPQFEISIKEGYEKTFYRVSLITDSGVIYSKKYPVMYIYPYYYLQQDEISSNMANLIYGTRGFSVVSDMPCMAITLASYENYGDDEGLWVTNGSELGVRIEEKSFNYTPATDDIPEGYYYVVYACYADGSSTMSQVFQK